MMNLLGRLMIVVAWTGASLGWAQDFALGGQESSDPARTEQRTFSISQVQLSKEALAQGMTLGNEPRCTSTQAEVFFEMPDLNGVVPAPAAKAAQSLISEAGQASSILYFQYPGPVPAEVYAMLQPLLWGGDRPTQEHPEEIVRVANMLLILCFPYGAAEAEQVKDHLRKKLGVPIARAWWASQPLLEADAAHLAREWENGIRVLRENWDRVQNYSTANYLLAELLVMGNGDGKEIERAYRRAIELDRSEDPLPGDGRLLWASLDGLGTQLGIHGRLEECMSVTQEALALARSLNDPKHIGRSEFVLAAAYTEQAQWEEALQNLQSALAHDPELKEAVKNDPSFKKALERKEFQELLGSGPP
jgi:tetratricopeptide (TPR) repeat protein